MHLVHKFPFVNLENLIVDDNNVRTNIRVRVRISLV